MKIVSFNINGLRARLHQLDAIIEKHKPDVIGLQETKVADEVFPLIELAALGYELRYFGQKAHYGVALLSKTIPQKVIYGFENDSPDAQKRFIGINLTYQNRPLTIYNGYFPQGENVKHLTKFPCKAQFYANLLHHLETHHQPNEQIIVMGDFNVAPTDQDIGIGEDARKRWLREGKTCFQPQERFWLNKIMQWGLFDSFRNLHQQTDDCFSWFDYRSRGFERTPKRGLRIDLMLVSQPLLNHLKASEIDYNLRAMERPSDHAPIYIELQASAQSD